MCLMWWGLFCSTSIGKHIILFGMFTKQVALTIKANSSFQTNTPFYIHFLSLITFCFLLLPLLLRTQNRRHVSQ